MATCPDCGCEPAPWESCRQIFDLCLALEFEHPGTYGSVHHLTVLCYMLQHNQYSREGWFAARKLLAQLIEGRTTIPEIRERVRSGLGLRSQSLVQGEKLAEVQQIVWSQNISSLRRTSPEVYCADVTAWARAVVRDSRQVA